MQEEIWKDIPGYEGYYQASNLGNIRSVDRVVINGSGKNSHTSHIKGKMLKQYISRKNGYAYVALSVNGVSKTKRVHVLIAKTWIDNPCNKPQVNHIDGNKANNNINNLEWVTQSENMLHAYNTGLEKKNGKAVIDLDTREIFETITDAAKSIGINCRCSMIQRVCDGRRSHYRNRHFAYYEDYLNGTIPEFKGKFTKKASEKLWR